MFRIRTENRDPSVRTIKVEIIEINIILYTLNPQLLFLIKYDKYHKDPKTFISTNILNSRDNLD